MKYTNPHRGTFLIFFLILISSPLTSQTTFNKQVRECFQSAAKTENMLSRIGDCMIGKSFVPFTIMDVFGNEHKSDDMDSDYLINFWFESCPPCKVEKPFLERFESEYPHIPVFSLCRDDASAFEPYEHMLERWICVSNYENQSIIQNKFGYPLTILVDKDHKIKGFYIGGIVKEELYMSLVKKI